MGGGDKLPSQGERGRGCKGSVRMALLPAGMASFAWEFHVTDPFGNYVYNGAPPPLCDECREISAPGTHRSCAACPAASSLRPPRRRRSAARGHPLRQPGAAASSLRPLPGRRNAAARGRLLSQQLGASCFQASSSSWI